MRLLIVVASSASLAFSQQQQGAFKYKDSITNITAKDCVAGDLGYATDAIAGANVYVCGPTANTWKQTGIQSIACVGTPGNTTGIYLQQCQTGAGTLYACNNAANCAVAADWVAVAGGAPTGAAGGVLSGSYPNPGIASSVALPGSPTTTTQSQGDNSTKIATTAYTDTSVSRASQGVANIISSSGAINTTETAIVSYTVPANSIKAGTEYQIELTGTCTATAANASNLRMRWGSNGPGASIGSDTQLATITPTSATSGTNQPFKVTYNVVFQSATVALATGYLQNVSTLGINTTTAPVFSTSIGTTVTGLTTTSNEFLSFTYVSAATTTTSTFYFASIRLVKQ